MLECVDDAFLDRWNVVARHHAAGDLVLEYEAGIAWQRFNIEDDIAELAVPAGLLLVPAALLDRLSDRFPVADSRPAPFDRDAEALGQPLGRDPQMHLALAPHHHLVSLGIVDHRERGVLLDQLVESKAELDVVLAFLRRDRNGEHARIRLRRRDRGVRLLARRQRLAGLGMTELPDPARPPSGSWAALLGRLPQQPGNTGDAPRLF